MKIYLALFTIFLLVSNNKKKKMKKRLKRCLPCLTSRWKALERVKHK